MNKEEVTQFLRDIDRSDLARLVEWSDVRWIRVETWLDEYEVMLELSAPAVVCEAVHALSQHDKERIIDAVVAAAGGATIVSRPTDLRCANTAAPLSDIDAVLPLLMIERAQLIAVATGGPRIQEVNDFYKARRKRLASALQSTGVELQCTFADLWEWYEFWRERFGSYAERRQFIHEIYDAAIATIAGGGLRLPRAPAPTGWTRADRTLVKARDRLTGAQHEEDYQAVGLLCREVIISVAQAVYDPARHKTADGVVPSNTDAARMIEAFIATELSGGANEVTRAHAKAALKLTVELQHRRTATFRLAALCLEATGSVLAIMAILSGQRDGTP